MGIFRPDPLDKKADRLTSYLGKRENGGGYNPSETISGGMAMLEQLPAQVRLYQSIQDPIQALAALQDVATCVHAIDMNAVGDWNPLRKWQNKRLHDSMVKDIDKLLQEAQQKANIAEQQNASAKKDKEGAALPQPQQFQSPEHMQAWFLETHVPWAKGQQGNVDGILNNLGQQGTISPADVQKLQAQWQELQLNHSDLFKARMGINIGDPGAALAAGGAAFMGSIDKALKGIEQGLNATDDLMRKTSDTLVRVEGTINDVQETGRKVSELVEQVGQAPGQTGEPKSQQAKPKPKKRDDASSAGHEEQSKGDTSGQQEHVKEEKKKKPDKKQAKARDEDRERDEDVDPDEEVLSAVVDESPRETPETERDDDAGGKQQKKSARPPEKPEFPEAPTRASQYNLAAENDAAVKAALAELGAIGGGKGKGGGK